jgi:hypothetical protein
MEVASSRRSLGSGRRGGPRRVAAAALFLAVLAMPAAAEPVAISEEKPVVVVDVPAAFVSKSMERGVQLKTPDGEIYVWFETFGPDEIDALIKEHNDYWAKEGVSLGGDTDRFEKDFGGKKVVATDYKGATWKGKPTVIRYLAIDANLPSQKCVLMSLWASPESDKAHDDEVMGMIGSLKINE